MQALNKSKNINNNKIDVYRWFLRQRNNRFPNRRRNRNDLGILYNYIQRPQKYGSGRLLVNFEQNITVGVNSQTSYTPVTNTDEMVTACSQFMYVKVLCYAVIQDKLNFPNENGHVAVYAYWGRNQEQSEDVFYNDNAKILPNQGWANFQFKPPRSILNEEFAISSEGVQKRWFNPAEFNPVDQMYSMHEGWKFGVHFWVRNATNSLRTVRFITRLIFRGKRVSDLSASKAISDSIDKEKVFQKYIKNYVYKGKNENEKIIGEVIELDTDKNIEKEEEEKILKNNIKEEDNPNLMESQVKKEEEKEVKEPLKLSNCNAYYLRKGKIYPLIFPDISDNSKTGVKNNDNTADQN